MKAPKDKTETTKQYIKRWEFTNDLLVALAGNPEVYKGTAQDAVKLPKLAAQIVDEFLLFIESEG